MDTWVRRRKTQVLAGTRRQAVASQGTVSQTGVPEVSDKVTSPSWHWAPYGPVTPASLPARVGRRLSQTIRGGCGKQLLSLLNI